MLKPNTENKKKIQKQTKKQKFATIIKKKRYDFMQQKQKELFKKSEWQILLQKRAGLKRQRQEEHRIYRKKIQQMLKMQKTSNRNNFMKESTFDKLKKNKDIRQMQKRQNYIALNELTNNVTKKLFDIERKSNIPNAINKLKQPIDNIIANIKSQNYRTLKKDIKNEIRQKNLDAEKKNSTPTTSMKQPIQNDLLEKDNMFLTEKQTARTHQSQVAEKTKKSKLDAKYQIPKGGQKRQNYQFMFIDDKPSENTAIKSINIQNIKSLHKNTYPQKHNFKSLKDDKIQSQNNKNQNFENFTSELNEILGNTNAILHNMKKPKQRDTNQIENMQTKSQDEQNVLSEELLLPTKKYQETTNTALNKLAEPIQTNIDINNQENKIAANNSKQIKKTKQVKTISVNTSKIKDPNEKTSKQKMQSYNLSPDAKKIAYQQLRDANKKSEKPKFDIKNENNKFKLFIKQLKQKKLNSDKFACIYEKQDNKTGIQTSTNYDTNSATTQKQINS